LGDKGGNSGKSQRYEEGYQEIRRIHEESEAHKGTVIEGRELLRRTKGIMGNLNTGRYDRCRIWSARWRMACSRD
jgi:hypothetical protein